MGKQINYYMGYQDFLSVAQAALDSGCVIYRHTYEDGRWRLTPGTTLDVVQPDCREYYFHICILRDGTKGRLQIGVAGMLWRDKKYDRPAG